MVVVSYSGKEINAKLVYYGPGLCGKTTNLEHVYDSIPSTHRGKMVSMKTRTERTLFFDFLPVDLGELGGFKTRFLLYTVPGQVYYNATRKLVLRGVDAVVFVADSARGKMNENLESLENLKENLREYGLDLATMPWVLQFNKRDLPDVYSIEEMNQALNPGGVPHFEAVATSGAGVFDTLKGVSRILLQKLSKEIKLSPKVADAGAVANKPAPAEPKAAPAVAPASSAKAPVASTPTASNTPSSRPPASASAPAASEATLPSAAAGVRVWSPPPPRPAATPASAAITASSLNAGTSAPDVTDAPEKVGFGGKLARMFGFGKKDASTVDANSSAPVSSAPLPMTAAAAPPSAVPATPRAAVVTSGASTRISRIDPAPVKGGASAKAAASPSLIEKRITVPVSLELTSDEIQSGSRVRLVLDIDLTTMTATVEREKRTGTD